MINKLWRHEVHFTCALFIYFYNLFWYYWLHECWTGFYLVKEWNRAATLLMLALTRTEWTLLEFVSELFHYAWGEMESRLKIMNSRQFDVWVDTRFYHPTRHAPFFPPPRHVPFAVVKGMFPCKVLEGATAGRRLLCVFPWLTCKKCVIVKDM